MFFLFSKTNQRTSQQLVKLLTNTMDYKKLYEESQKKIEELQKRDEVAMKLAQSQNKAFMNQIEVERNRNDALESVRTENTTLKNQIKELLPLKDWYVKAKFFEAWLIWKDCDVYDSICTEFDKEVFEDYLIFLGYARDSELFNNIMALDYCDDLYGTDEHWEEYERRPSQQRTAASPPVWDPNPATEKGPFSHRLKQHWDAVRLERQ